MKILEIKKLAIPEIKIIKFARFCDDRGYFTEKFRKSDLLNIPSLEGLKNAEFVQTNQIFSKKNTIRGLHFQWNPYMGKLVHIVCGRMTEIILDIRIGSPTFGKSICYDMRTDVRKDNDEWIWVPPGFAHGNFYKEDSIMEYYCTGEYNENSEAGISPLAKDINWFLCDKKDKEEFDKISSKGLLSDKDKKGFSLSDWERDDRSKNFIYEELIQKKLC